MRPTVRYFWAASVILAVFLNAVFAEAQTPVQRAKAAAKKAAVEKTAAEKLAAEKTAVAKTAAEKAAAMNAAARQRMAEKVAAQKALQDANAKAAAARKVLTEKNAAAKAAAQAAVAARKAARKAATEKAAADKTLRQKAAAEKAAADKVVAEIAYQEKIAAAKAAVEKTKAIKTAGVKAAAAKAAASQLAVAKVAADKAGAENGAAEKALAAVSDADKPALQKSLDDKNAAVKAATDKANVAKVAADKATAELQAAQKVVAEKATVLLAGQEKAAVTLSAALGGLKPLAGSEWSYGKARHLLVRAGFGGTPDEVQKLYQMGLHDAVNYMVNIYDRPQANIEFDVMRLERPEPWEGRLERDERTSLSNRRISRERRQQAELRRWWLRRMAESPRPLQEKLTLFWHDHFAVQYRELYRTYMLLQQNQLFRTYGCDNYAALLHGIVQDPAMIRYLDNHANVKGRGNENLGRELQELFSIGEEFSANHKPDGYTEKDVREASRALTGYTYDSWTGQFRFFNAKHDKANKTVLGRTGNFSGDEVVDIILQHPSTAKYISKKLFVFFVYESPEPETVDRLAHLLRTCGYDLRPMLRNLFLSETFYSDKAIGSHIKSPAELVVGAIRDLNVKNVNYAAIDSAVVQMGQTLFEPPNVAGWDENKAWINAERILTRYNQMASLIERSKVDLVALLEGKGLQTPQQVVDFLAKACLAVPPSDAKRDQLASFLGQLPPTAEWAAKRDQLNAKLRILIVMLMSMPESQLG